jgi:hypothetical protein
MSDASADDGLLERLRRAGAEADPPPAHVLDAARGAFAWASAEGDLLDLRFDSSVDSAEAATRAGDGPRVLRFASQGCTAELELTGEGPWAVVGQVDPAGSGAVELRTSSGELRAPLDGIGRFTVDGVPPGPVSLAWSTADGRRLRTAWVGL